MKHIYAICLLLGIYCMSQDLHATHAMGADLTYRCIGGNQYVVRLSFYRDCNGIAPSTTVNVQLNSASCSQSISVSLPLLAGFPVEVSPICPSQIGRSSCNFAGTLPGVEEYVYEGTVTLPQACTDWVFSFREGFRNNAITTLTFPGNAYLYVEARLNNVVATCNSSPSFTSKPIPYICENQFYAYNHGAVDADGDSLVYTLIDALDNAGTTVGYNVGYSGINPLTSSTPLSIDPQNGTLNLTPNALQVGVVAVRVDEYRNGVLIGSVIRDIQVTVLSCTNSSPDILPLANLSGGSSVSPYQVEICPNTPLSFTVSGRDMDGIDSVFMSWNNGIPGATFTLNRVQPDSVVGTFSWTPGPGDIGLNNFVVSLQDNACPVIGTQSLAFNVLVLNGTTGGPDQDLCLSGNNQATLSALGGTVFTWRVISGDVASLACTNCRTQNVRPAATTQYEVVSNFACNPRDTIAVTLVPSFTLNISPDTTLCLAGNYPLQATPQSPGTYTYAWSPTVGLSNAAIGNPTASPAATTRYRVQVASNAGCVVEDSVDIRVENVILNALPEATPGMFCTGGDTVMLRANVINGDSNAYTVASIPFAPAAVPGNATNVTLGDDQVLGNLNIGFPFTFYGNTYTDFTLSSNGWMGFGTAYTASDASDDPIPSAGGTNTLIAFAWDDLNPAAGGTITYFTDGVAPNRRLVVTFANVPHFASALNTVSTQVILYEANNCIEIHNTQIDSDGGTMAQGIENSTGTIGVPVPGRSSTVWTATADAYRFCFSPPRAYTVSWEAPMGTAIGNTDTLMVAPTVQTDYYLVVQDSASGCESRMPPVNVDIATVDAGPNQVILMGNPTPLNGTYTGPVGGNCNNYLMNSIPFAPLGGNGAQVVGIMDDDVEGPFPIGFDFEFFCNTRTQFYISSNGFITFDNALDDGCCTGQNLPSPNQPDELIAFAWEDLDPGGPGGGIVEYFTVGAAPNRRLVVNFIRVPHFPGPSPNDDVTAQVILFEGSDAIEIHTTSQPNATGTHTMGIENLAGTLAFTPPGRNATSWTATNEAWRFRPERLTYSWTPAATLNDSTLEDPMCAPMVDTWFFFTVDNGECEMTDSVLIAISPLGAELLEFNARSEGRLALLNWQTAQEVGLSHFELESSPDGIAFGLAGQIPATGLSGEGQRYAFEDPELLNGPRHYRLKLIDFDGTHSFSDVRILVPGGIQREGLRAVYPIPAKDALFGQFDLAAGGEASFRLLDITGKRVLSRSQTYAAPGMYELSLSLGNLPTGLYVYQLELNGLVYTGKVRVGE
ncbi:MAG: hypothetical protein AAGI38_03990 [Bacteroidota bacterium]